MKMKIVNIEAGMPTVKEATVRLSLALRQAKAAGFATVKIIHGYGSTGRGGAIKAGAQGFLAGKKADRSIKGFVKGEDFSPFHSEARRLLDLCPELSRDSDYDRSNQGITIVLL